jgi:hypothetical protein
LTARRPIEGAAAVARLLASSLQRPPDAVVGILVINGAPTLRIEIPGVAAVVVSLAIEDGRIARIYALSNPDKLTLLDTETLLTRSN